MKQKYNIIISYQTEAKKDAMSELLIADGQAQLQTELSDEVALIETALPFAKLASIFKKAKPIFIRHMQPVDVIVHLKGSEQDLIQINSHFFDILDKLERNNTFSVQTRVLRNEAFKPFDVNALLSQTAINTGLTLDVSSPVQAVSVLIAENVAYIGISLCKDNLSSWAGGRRRFAKEEGQLSRAEFKLLEALEYFAIDIPNGTIALDLGAAPGGWSRVLLEKGALVTAVDPASLDKSIRFHENIKCLHATAQDFIAQNEQHFDLIVNDMRMDAIESARLICSLHPFLREGGNIIMTLKLQDKAMRSKALKAIKVLENVYTLIGARQLFHNRCEVTVVARKE